MFLSFALIAGQMLLALCEAYVGVGGGVLLLGFSGSRWTIKFAEGFLGWIVGVGIKLFFLYLLVGDWTDDHCGLEHRSDWVGQPATHRFP